MIQNLFCYVATHDKCNCTHVQKASMSVGKPTVLTVIGICYEIKTHDSESRGQEEAAYATTE